MLGLVLGILAAWWRGDPPPCEVFDRGEPVAAPNGSAQANWRNEACGDGWFVTVIFTVVEVTAGEAAIARDVVRVSETDLARRPVATGLSLSLASFALGTAALAFSAPGSAECSTLCSKATPQTHCNSWAVHFYLSFRFASIGQARAANCSTQAIPRNSPSRHGGERVLVTTI